MLFDSHSHLHFPQFDDDREEIVKKIADSGARVLAVGTDPEDSEKSIALAKSHPGIIWASVGAHPHDGRLVSGLFALEKLSDDANAVAIGECGLDYHLGKSDGAVKLQKEIFEFQAGLAELRNKPLVIHCRPSSGSNDAYEDVLEILRARKLNIASGNGVAHFFSGSKEIAKNFLDLGFFISFAGPITFSDEYREAVEYVPSDRILAETDAPFASPAPYRGKRNEPLFVEYVVRKMALWKKMEFEEMARQTFANAAGLFRVGNRDK